MHQFYRLVISIGATLCLVVLIAACGGQAPTPGLTDGGQTGIETESAPPTDLPPASEPAPPLPAGQSPLPTDTPEMPERPTPDSTSTDADAQRAIALAVTDLSQQLSLPEASILVDSVEAVQWPDASLGCPQPGMLYAQVETPGYLIVLAAGDQTYAYHTDRNQHVILCPDLSLSQPYTTGDSSLPIFVEMVQAPLSPELSPQMPPRDASPTGIYVFDPGDWSLLVAPTIQVLPTTQVLVGLTTASSPGRPYVASDLFQIPSAQPAPLRVVAVDPDTGTLTLAYADQTFELSPGQSHAFKQRGEGELALLYLTTITNHGRPATIGVLPTNPASP